MINLLISFLGIFLAITNYKEKTKLTPLILLLSGFLIGEGLTLFLMLTIL